MSVFGNDVLCRHVDILQKKLWLVHELATLHSAVYSEDLPKFVHPNILHWIKKSNPQCHQIIILHHPKCTIGKQREILIINLLLIECDRCHVPTVYYDKYIFLASKSSHWKWTLYILYSGEYANFENLHWSIMSSPTV